MAYDKNQLEKKSLAAIKKHKLKFVTYVASYLPCSRATFDNLELGKLDTIKESLEKNRIDAKTKTLNRWEKSENATLQVAFMKLIADDDEADRLNGSKQKHELYGKDGGAIQTETTHDITKLSIEKLKLLKEILQETKA